MGGARMHTSVSGCGDALFQDEEEALLAAVPALVSHKGNWIN
jgi:acetyl-CoA carboxylase carboxyltransferase component